MELVAALAEDMVAGMDADKAQAEASDAALVFLEVALDTAADLVLDMELALA